MFAVYLIVLAWGVWREVIFRAQPDRTQEGKQMDVNRSEKIRMLVRLLEPFEEEVRRAKRITLRTDLMPRKKPKRVKFRRKRRIF